MISVYLCGPMSEKTPEEAAQWRNAAASDLAVYGFQVVSPMRAKGMLRAGEVMGTNYESYGSVPALRYQSIFARDTFDVSHCDIVLANMNEATEGSIGSDFELGMAHAWGKQIVLVARKESIYRRHPFPVVAASIIFDELHDGVEWIIENFRPYNTGGRNNGR